jgi:hypothetical protein
MLLSISLRLRFVTSPQDRAGSGRVHVVTTGAAEELVFK